MSIRGVLFDFDGTLTEPGSLDFATLREILQCPKGRPILEFIETLPSKDARANARRILEEFEIEAARQSKPNAGAEEMVLRLRSRGLKLGILSRNSHRSILLALENFSRIGVSDFEIILSRDDSLPPKPSPESVIVAASRMEIPTDQILVVGDFVFDIEAGQKADAHTVFLTNRSPSVTCPVLPEFTIGHLDELEGVVDLFLPLPAGKLPNALLDRFLGELDIKDPSLVISPRVGEDIAAIALQGEEVLVLKSDPVTFATDAIASYAVIVNVNDIVTCGAVPRWLTTSLLFPPETNAAQIRKVMAELGRLSQEHSLVLCGGHTEITDAVTRPVVVGQVVGTVSRRRLINKRNMHAGDCILLTKAIALEGTCILAREIPEKLEGLGISPTEIEKCCRFLHEPGIGIVMEARIAAASGKVTAMHDVTEGGLATALEELSTAGGHRLRVSPERIPVLEETRRICSLLNLDALGLIGSGSLLIACDAEAAEEINQSIRRAGIDVTCIGVVMEEGSGVEAINERGEIVSWPHFAVDEIARLFSS